MATDSQHKGKAMLVNTSTDKAVSQTAANLRSEMLCGSEARRREPRQLPEVRYFDSTAAAWLNSITLPPCSRVNCTASSRCAKASRLGAQRS